ncbi:Gx transporter family protein [Clostridium sp. AM58-1XD]|uniref:Gx transporter family protein n=1 Tax=Clostridium sp. AM58-1XD TaxID=2292307 RepID=UPI000E473598|nr:Gx transporter family protein [Clostridium sp. AM58-1XD]RGZ00960.1 heptaprenyl diphosphate synthase [Clostridium sp. AM58-1XD]
MGRSSRERTEFISKYGMLIALAFIFSYIESLIPIPLPVPGMKLGLANLVTIVGLYTVGIPGTITVSLIRIVLVGMTFGNMFSMWYGLAGGALSLILMIVCRAAKWFSPVGVSVAGGVGHNIGQILIAAFVVENKGVFYYLPALMAGGVAAGAVIGLLGGMIIVRTERFFRSQG